MMELMVKISRFENACVFDEQLLETSVGESRS